MARSSCRCRPGSDPGREEYAAALNDAYRVGIGLPTWADNAYAWRERGVELAASTIAWALTDEPVVHPEFAGRCSELEYGFTALTGKAVPGSGRCPDYVSPSGPAG